MSTLSALRLACAVSLAAVILPSEGATLLGYTTGPQDGSPPAGKLIDPNCCDTFGLHDHRYIATNVPDPSRAVVVFTFDTPVVVSAIDMVQHANGITLLEQFVGNDISSLASVGVAWSSHGDVTGSGLFVDGSHDPFVFTSDAAGTIHEFIIRKTSLGDGYASFRWYLDFASPVPEPETAVTLFAGLAVLGAAKVSRRR